MWRETIKMKMNSRGMTIVELIVVMAILSVVMLAAMSIYIPAQQSTFAQTQVSDIQSNLRLALRVLTQDLMNAGFLEQEFPLVFTDAPGGVTDPTDIGTQNSADFVIRTRIAGNNFARISNAINVGVSDVALTVTDADMVNNFPDESLVRLFEPVSSDEVMLVADPPDTSDAARVYTVQSSSGTTVTIAKNGTLDAGDILQESVMVRVRNASEPPLQTIRYRLNDGALERIVNGKTQFLSRNVDTSNTSLGGTSFFDFDYTDTNRVNRVEIHLSGKTKAWKDDAVSGTKTREMVSFVKLRNVF